MYYHVSNAKPLPDLDYLVFCVAIDASVDAAMRISGLRFTECQYGEMHPYTGRG